LESLFQEVILRKGDEDFTYLSSAARWSGTQWFPIEIGYNVEISRRVYE